LTDNQTDRQTDSNPLTTNNETETEAGAGYKLIKDHVENIAMAVRSAW